MSAEATTGNLMVRSLSLKHEVNELDWLTTPVKAAPQWPVVPTS